MKILTRPQFADHWNSFGPELLGDNDSPLWWPENDGVRCQWFIGIRPIYSTSKLITVSHSERQSYFHSWCENNLKGQARCFSSSDEDLIEWWGFTNQQDIVWFLMRWA